MLKSLIRCKNQGHLVSETILRFQEAVVHTEGGYGEPDKNLLPGTQTDPSMKYIQHILERQLSEELQAPGIEIKCGDT